MPKGTPWDKEEIEKIASQKFFICRICKQETPREKMKFKRRSSWEVDEFLVPDMCHNCNNEKNRKYRKNESEEVKKARYKRNTLRIHGLTPENYEEILQLHENKCAVCKSEENLCVDHDHTTGKVRGILCNSCNAALGMLKDDPNIIWNLYLYLKVGGPVILVKTDSCETHANGST